MAKMAKMKDVTVSIAKDKIMYTNISKSADGYNSARLVAKMGEKEYMSISYEWEGEGVPGFAMDLMSSMQAAEIKSGEVASSWAEDYNVWAKKKGLPPWMKKDDKDGEDEEDNKDKKGKKDKKEKKDKKSKGADGTKPVPADTTKSKSPGVCSNCGLADADCTCDGKKQLQKTKEKKGS